jgi:hypothetical protein
MSRQIANHSFLVCALFITAALLFGGTLGASHDDHDHEEDDCFVCIVLQHLENSTRQLKTPPPQIALVPGAGSPPAPVQEQLLCSIPTSSVKLKIRMNT